MLITPKHNWISGTLELTSKVRYGMTTRGVPIFRFIPYDKLLPPLAVGCSQRNLFYNVHAVVEPSAPSKEGELQRANLIQNLGRPTNQTEQEVILVAYAYDNSKQQKAFPPYELPTITHERPFLKGLTFHIDPPGCKDVDDTFTICKDIQTPDTWNIAINIADVSELVLEDSPLDLAAKQRATSFYTPGGEDIYPMLPKEVSEQRHHSYQAF
jgi:exoribonuclease R